jgi:hypothetical protein
MHVVALATTTTLGLAALGTGVAHAEQRTTRAPLVGIPFTTSMHEMTCTSMTGEGSVRTCTGGNSNLGSWKVKVDCTAGWTYESIWGPVPQGNSTTLGPDNRCFVGVNSIEVVETDQF